DFPDNEDFDIFNISSFKKSLDNIFNNQSLQKTQERISNSNNQVTKVINDPEDGMTLFINELYLTFSKLFNKGRSAKDIIISFVSETASESGCAAADRMLGEYCYKLNRYDKAFNLLICAADNENALAMITLGKFYQKGYGTNVDKVEGFKSFKKAAKMGLPVSQYELGDCYEF
ncbi:1373_t:CDS:2, partial [Racocetra persica]